MKMDIARTFQNICIDSMDVLKLGICHDDKYYINKSLAFGVVHGTAIFYRCDKCYFKNLGDNCLELY